MSYRIKYYSLKRKWEELRDIIDNPDTTKQEVVEALYNADL